jgi:poly(A) polymerase
MDAAAVLNFPDGTDTASRVRDLVASDPLAVIHLATAISHAEGPWPVDSVIRAAADEIASLNRAPGVPLREAVEACLMGREVDHALEWLHLTGAMKILFPELEATVDLVQETGRQHKDVWAHTKQVVKQTVRRPDVRWAALLHDIGKVPTRTFTPNGVHFHGHAEVGARMFDGVSRRIPFDRDQRKTVRFLIRHHLRSNQYSAGWTDSAVRRFAREMQVHMVDLLDLSRADITSKRPGRRKALLEQISALSDRIDRLTEEDARLPPLPGGVGTAIMASFKIAPSKLIGDLKRALEEAITQGSLEARREDAYYVAWLARAGIVPGVDPELNSALAAAGGLSEEAAAAEAPEPELHDDHSADPDDPEAGPVACGADAEVPCGPADDDDDPRHRH